MARKKSTATPPANKTGAAGTAAAQPAKVQASADSKPADNSPNSAQPASNPAATTAPASPSAPPKNEGPKTVDVLMVNTVRGVPTLRRAGFRFSREPLGIEVTALTEEQIQALEDEPKLEVEAGQADITDASGESNA